jgi:hypothetical protein
VGNVGQYIYLPFILTTYNCLFPSYPGHYVSFLHLRSFGLLSGGLVFLLWQTVLQQFIFLLLRSSNSATEEK